VRHYVPSKGSSPCHAKEHPHSVVSQPFSARHFRWMSVEVTECQHSSQHGSRHCGEYCSEPNIIRMIKSRMRWAGHVTEWGKRSEYRILAGRPEGKRRDVVGWIIIK
jgi:hypothetical protein